VASGTFAELMAEHPDFREYVKAQDLTEGESVGYFESERSAPAQ
jgi:hypothetical protein